MTEWTEVPGVRLIHGDCLDVMPTLDAGSIDLILSDLPYGVTACKWDAVIPFGPLWECFRHVLKPRGAVVLTACQPFTSMLVMSNREWFRGEWIWEKQKAANFQQCRIKPLRVHESVLVFAERIGTYNPQMVDDGKRYKRSRFRSSPSYLRPGSSVAGGCDVEREYSARYPRSIVKFSNESGNPGSSIHCCRKPVALFEYLIKTYSNEGETVLDVTIGSGTTAVACLNAGRRCVGVEREAEYVEISKRRVREAAAETPLFS